MTDQKKATKAAFERKKPEATVQELMRRARALQGIPETEPPSKQTTSDPDQP